MNRNTDRVHIEILELYTVSINHVDSRTKSNRPNYSYNREHFGQDFGH